ncbi:lysozyme inhibitor LprI family protein [Pantoea ananatis]|uniref:lysozyme inhibitor LprI family protein n=1 Tax=Pantoea ananas TaxID=553 RepID=UPI000F8819D5|nr:hypothetical protein [Pantoea ananatis]RQN07019.1 hypothetical protein EHQ51_20125 [Pantoea ananatis]
MKTGFSLVTYFIKLALLMSGLMLAFQASAAPSFSCAHPSAIEKVICQSQTLSAKDRLMAHFFDLAKKNATAGPSGLITAQRQWLKNLTKMCLTDPQEKRIEGYYDQRLFELAVMVLYTHHGEAIKQIRKTNPELVNIYEAIYQFTSLPAGSTRHNKVTELIRPAFEVTDNHIFEDKIPDAESAAENTNNFGMFLWLIAENNPESLIIPCEAFLRHPQNIVWLEPLAGGAIDSRTPISDCEQTQPTLPLFKQFIHLAEDATPVSTGTIRFTIYAITRAEISATLSHSMKFLKSIQYGKNSLSDDAQQFIKQHTEGYQNSLIELAHYYQHAFNMPADTANSEARRSITILLNNITDDE